MSYTCFFCKKMAMGEPTNTAQAIIETPLGKALLTKNWICPDCVEKGLTK